MLRQLMRFGSILFLAAVVVGGIVWAATRTTEPAESLLEPTSPTSAPAGQVVTRERAPNLSLPDWETSVVWSLDSTIDPDRASAPRGFLVAFVASDCLTCVASLRKLSELERGTPDLAVIIVTVDSTTEGRDTQLELMRQSRMTGPLLVADDATVTTWIGSARSVPRYFFIDRAGVVTEAVTGFDADINAMMPSYAKIAMNDRRSSAPPPTP